MFITDKFMKTNKLIQRLMLAALLVVACVAVCRFGIRKRLPDVPAAQQVDIIVEKNDCFVCHSAQPKLPFYSKLPVIGPMMAQHAAHAFDMVDLESAFAEGGQLDEVTLAKIDHAVSYGTMPIHQYRMIHWGTGLNNKEKSVMAGWIAQNRKELGVDAFQCIPESLPVDADMVALGEKLYNEPWISLDGTISCASCHIIAEGGADEADERTSEGINGLHGGVNAPTVLNAVFNVRQFWNGRAADLKEQAAGPPVNPVEMGDQTWEQIAERVAKLYPSHNLDPDKITAAIAEYEKTLLTPGSRFDAYLSGDGNALDEDELNGFELFKKLSCASCHTGVILGGKSFEKLGIYEDYFAQRDPQIEYNADDEGLKGFTGNDADLHRFKVPGLRNVTRTAPYFHDGTRQSLEEAVRDMAKYELGKKLSDKEVELIVAFMGSI